MADTDSDRHAELERSCEGCGYRRKVVLCGRFSFVKPHYLCAGCQKVLGAVKLGGYR